MSEDYIKLAAKVQHFYEILVAKNNAVLDQAIYNNPDRQTAREKSSDLSELIDEYEQAFESFLYKKHQEI